MPKYIVVFLLIAGAAGLFFAGREVLRQDRVSRTFIAVPAQIISSDVPNLHAKNSVAYSPAIHYRYSIRGGTYESGRIWLYPESVGSATAEEMLRQFPPGARVTAYVDPATPNDALLIRNYSSLMYWPLAGAIAVFFSGLGALCGIVAPGVGSMRTVPLDSAGEPAGWHTLLPTWRLKDRLREKAYLFVSIDLPILALSIHPALTAAPLSPWGWAFIVVAIALVIVQLFFLLRAFIATSRTSDPRLSVKPAPMRRGGAFSLRMEMDIYRALAIVNLEVRVVCIETILCHYGRRTMLAVRPFGEQVVPVESRTAAAAGATLMGAADLRFDASRWPASGRTTMSTYPHYCWEIQVRLTGSRTCITRFPIDVE